MSATACVASAPRQDWLMSLTPNGFRASAVAADVGIPDVLADVVSGDQVQNLAAWSVVRFGERPLNPSTHRLRWAGCWTCSPSSNTTRSSTGCRRDGAQSRQGQVADSPQPLAPAVLRGVADHVATILTDGTGSQTKASIETLIAEIKIAGPETAIPVFRVLPPALHQPLHKPTTPQPDRDSRSGPRREVFVQ